MDCAVFHDRLDALLDGALPSLDEAEVHRADVRSLQRALPSHAG